ncbi:MAG: type II toxin-antitoxin system HicA family toxin [Candidatus Micrarchaeota archaeon]
MPALRPLKLRQVVRALTRCGFVFKNQKGSHAKFVHPDGRMTIVPMHSGEMIGRGLLKDIVAQSGIPIEEFLENA